MTNSCKLHGVNAKDGCHGCVEYLIATEQARLAEILDSKPTNPKDMIGSDKLPIHLFPSTAIIAGCLAFLEGMLKYGRTNFRAVGVRASIYYGAEQRHIQAWWEGQDIDKESGLPHLYKALACIAILIDADAAGKLNDDRMYPGGYAKLMEQLTPLVKQLKEKYKDIDPKHYTVKDAQ